eukprot:4528644-Amphidinium_carterae.1
MKIPLITLGFIHQSGGEERCLHVAAFIHLVISAASMTPNVRRCHPEGCCSMDGGKALFRPTLELYAATLRMP